MLPSFFVKFPYLIISLLFFPFLAEAQLNERLVDSLQQKLQKLEVNSQQKVDILNAIGEEIGYYSPDSALVYVNEAIEIAHQLDYKKGLVNALNLQGVNLKDKNSLVPALKALQEANEINSTLDNAPKKAAILYNISSVHYIVSDLKAALDTLLVVIEIDEMNQDSVGLGYDYFRLAEIYLDLSDYPRTEFYLSKSLEIRQKLNDEINLVHIYNLYLNMNIDKKAYESALDYAQKGYELASKLKLPKETAVALRLKGEVLLAQEKITEAMGCFESALKIAKENNIQSSRATAIHDLGYALGLNGQEKKGLFLLNEARLMYDSLKLNAPKPLVHTAMYEIYKKNKQWKKALESYQIAAEEKLRITDIQLNKELAKIELNYQIKLKDKENKQLKIEKQNSNRLAENRQIINYLLGGFLLLTTLLLILLYQNYQQKHNFGLQMEIEVEKKTEELSHAYQKLNRNHKELKLFYATIAHDFRNPVLLTQSYLEQIAEELNLSDHKGLTKSKKALDDLYASFETLMKFFRMEGIPLMKKSVNLNNLITDIYLELQQLNIGQHIQLNVQKLPTIKADALLLRQVIYNLILNAAKSTMYVEQPKLDIFAVSNNQKIELCFEDNGKGIPKDIQSSIFDSFVSGKNLTNSNLGIGLFIVKQIMERHQGSITFKINPTKGVTFILIFPK